MQRSGSHQPWSTKRERGGRARGDDTRRATCDMRHTSFRATRGGPAAISSAFVPGCMRRFAFASLIVCSICCAWRLAVALKAGDLGPSWISAAGGGLGSRGDPCARDMALCRMERPGDLSIYVFYDLIWLLLLSKSSWSSWSSWLSWFS